MEDSWKILIDRLNSVDNSIKDLNDDVKDLDKKVEIHSIQTKSEIEEVKKQDVIQNQLLEEHMKRCHTLEQMHLSREAKVDAEILELKKPAQFLLTLKKVILGAGALAAALVAIGKFLQWF